MFPLTLYRLSLLGDTNQTHCWWGSSVHLPKGCSRNLVSVRRIAVSSAPLQRSQSRRGGEGAVGQFHFLKRSLSRCPIYMSADICIPFPSVILEIVITFKCILHRFIALSSFLLYEVFAMNARMRKSSCCRHSHGVLCDVLRCK